MTKSLCSNCRNQMTGWDGGFFGLPFTCECRIYGETEGRKNCSKFKKRVTKSDLLNKIQSLEKENEQLRKIGVMYQGHNPCSNCTYCLENKLCCGINPPMLCDEMKKDYFIYGLCKKHRQIQKSIRRYDDE